MKVLFINIIHPVEKTETGGTFINKRNCNLMKDIYGENNLIIYNMIYYKNPIQTLRNTIFCRAGGYKKSDLKSILTLIHNNNISIVFIGFSNAATLARDLKKKCSDIKIMTFCHNNEYTFLKQSLKSFSFIKRIFYLFNVHATYISEKNACKYSDILITINKRDSSDFEKIYNRKADYVIPISFVDKFNISKSKTLCSNDSYLLFVGSNFFGNTEGVFWFIENCMSEIKYKLIVVGSGMDIYKNKYPDKNVEFLGYVEDLSEYYYKASAVVLPILSGSGMKTKTCEGLMYGKTIFGSKEAFEGYNCEYDKVGKLCSSKEDFIQAINSFEKKSFNEYSRYIYLNNYDTKFITEQFKTFLKAKNFL